MFSLFLLCAGLGVAVEGRYMVITHPQTAYCNADFVTVRSESTTSTTKQAYRGFNIVIDHVYKGQTWLDKLTSKDFLYFTTPHATTYPEVGKSYIMSGNVYEGKFYAAEHNILETITDPSVETMFTKRFQAYDCSCGICHLLYLLSSFP